MRKILVRAPQWLGDAVTSTVFLNRLKEKKGGVHLSVLCSTSISSLFGGHPAVNSVITFNHNNGQTVLEISRQIKAQGFDEVFVLPRSFRTALEVWLARIPIRVGFRGDGRTILLTKALGYDRNLSYPHRYLKLIDEENLPLENMNSFFPVADLDEKKASGIVQVDWEKLNRPFLAMAPASISPARTWEPDRFCDVANHFLSQTGGTIFLFGSPKEQKVARPLSPQIKGRLVDTVGKLDLPQLGWFLSQCDLCLTNDSGLMHVASAFKIPTVVLFGPSDPTMALPPWGIVKAVQHQEVTCVPCLRNTCARFGPYNRECMKAISTEEVLQSLYAIYPKK